HVGAAGTDTLDHFAVMCPIHAWLGGLWIAHVDVDDGRARLGGVDARRRDLRRGHGHGRIFTGRVRRAGHRTRNHYLALHAGLTPPSEVLATIESLPPLATHCALR